MSSLQYISLSLRLLLFPWLFDEEAAAQPLRYGGRGGHFGLPSGSTTGGPLAEGSRLGDVLSADPTLADGVWHSAGPSSFGMYCEGPLGK